MSLHLGDKFNRQYNLRIPILSGYYDINIFYSTKNTHLLFDVVPDFSDSTDIQKNGIKIRMFKNIESSEFCELFLNLHNYRKETLDIVNQFNSIKSEFIQDISFGFNEKIVLAKKEIHDKTVFETLNIYAFLLNDYHKEFLFLLTERHNISKMLGKKMVRTTGLQIATSQSLKTLKDIKFNYDEMKKKNMNLKMENEIIQTDVKRII
jgi:hypothetical protein